MVPSWDQIASILSRPTSERGKPTVAVIDWEFASASGRGVNGDMAQLPASLHCHWIYLEALVTDGAGDVSGAEDSRNRLRRAELALVATTGVVRGLCTAYAKTARIQFHVTGKDPVMPLLRSAFDT